MSKSRPQKVNPVLAAIAVILLVVLLAAYNREQIVETEDHVWCLAAFGGGAPGSKEYIECRRARDARAGRDVAR
jgi:hypothetical protein